MSWTKEQILNVVATDVEIAHIMRNSFEPVALSDDKGYFVMINNAWEAVTGFTKKELCSKPFKFFLHKEDYMETMKVYYESHLFDKEAKPVKGFTNRYRTTDKGKYAKLRWLEIGRNNEGFSLSIAEFQGYEYT